MPSLWICYSEAVWLDRMEHYGRISIRHSHACHRALTGSRRGFVDGITHSQIAAIIFYFHRVTCYPHRQLHYQLGRAQRTETDYRYQSGSEHALLSHQQRIGAQAWNPSPRCLYKENGHLFNIFLLHIGVSEREGDGASERVTGRAGEGLAGDQVTGWAGDSMSGWEASGWGRTGEWVGQKDKGASEWGGSQVVEGTFVMRFLIISYIDKYICRL